METDVLTRREYSIFPTSRELSSNSAMVDFEADYFESGKAPSQPRQWRIESSGDPFSIRNGTSWFVVDGHFIIILPTDLVGSKALEELSLDPSLQIDETSLPGELVTESTLRRRQQRENLLELIDLFGSSEFSWDNESLCFVSEESAFNTKRFVALLSDDTPFPKISPDGESGILMVWKNDKRQTSVSINNDTLSLVRNAASDRASYHDGIKFYGDQIPEMVREAIVER